jgi:hypothetical protein
MVYASEIKRFFRSAAPMTDLVFLLLLSTIIAGGFQRRGPFGGAALYAGGSPGLLVIGLVVIVVAWRFHPL